MVFSILWNIIVIKIFVFLGMFLFNIRKSWLVLFFICICVLFILLEGNVVIFVLEMFKFLECNIINFVDLRILYLIFILFENFFFVRLWWRKMLYLRGLIDCGR